MSGTRDHAMSCIGRKQPHAWCTHFAAWRSEVQVASPQPHARRWGTARRCCNAPMLKCRCRRSRMRCCCVKSGVRAGQAPGAKDARRSASLRLRALARELRAKAHAPLVSSHRCHSCHTCLHSLLLGPFFSLTPDKLRAVRISLPFFLSFFLSSRRGHDFIHAIESFSHK